MFLQSILVVLYCVFLLVIPSQQQMLCFLTFISAVKAVDVGVYMCLFVSTTFLCDCDLLSRRLKIHDCSTNETGLQDLVCNPAQHSILNSFCLTATSTLEFIYPASYIRGLRLLRMNQLMATLIAFYYNDPFFSSKDDSL